jgi:hypothetical protein
MWRFLASILAATFVQLPTTQAPDLPTLLQHCWGNKEIKTSRNTSFEQDKGFFRGEVQRRWCHTSLEAWGRVTERGTRGRSNRDFLSRIDSLTLHFSTDTINAELKQRTGENARLVVNGKPANADWWSAATRERILRLARVPLD